jgi:hypothetical protein
MTQKKSFAKKVKRTAFFLKNPVKKSKAILRLRRRKAFVKFLQAKNTYIRNSKRLKAIGERVNQIDRQLAANPREREMFNAIIRGDYVVHLGNQHLFSLYSELMGLFEEEKKIRKYNREIASDFPQIKKK